MKKILTLIIVTIVTCLSGCTEEREDDFNLNSSVTRSTADNAEVSISIDYTNNSDDSEK